MTWETVIGPEIHVQLNIKAKIFSGVSTVSGAGSNVCAGAADAPCRAGILPVMSRKG
ncbi:hypothetical protein [Neisseria leonii]|uniref:hypothetical protein n=1 Tax=Neisseria leonii TaxID=2995413 RepID=UPI003460F3C1